MPNQIELHSTPMQHNLARSCLLLAIITALVGVGATSGTDVLPLQQSEATEHWHTSWQLHDTTNALADDPTTQSAPIGECGPATLTQSIVPITMESGSIQCAGSEPAPYTTENGLARSFAIPDGAPFIVQCVEFGIEINTDVPWNVQVNIYTGDIDGPFEELEMLASTTLTIPAWASSDFFTATFPEPVEFAGGSTMIVELFTPSRNPAEGGPGGLTFFGSNKLGESAPSYLRAPACNANSFVSFESIGFPKMNLLMNVRGYEMSLLCPADLSGDGVVDGADLLILLQSWGECSDPGNCPADINSDGVVNGTDLLTLLAAWGACPELPEPTGACCVEPKNCQQLTADECDYVDGFYAGPGSDCETFQGCGLRGQCDGLCGQNAGDCWCDSSCFVFGDCCDDICHDCPHYPECVECYPAVCPDDGIDEGEPCGTDLNEGCNLIPHQYTPISCGDTICGTVWAQSGSRDTDWFELDLTGFDGPVRITWTAQSGIPINAFIMHHFCPTIVVASSVGCQPATSYCFEPGVYSVFIAPTALNHHQCGGSGPVDYVATITCDVDTGCVPPEPTCAGQCGGSSPGGCWCDSSCDAFGDCCDDVCDHCPGLHFCYDSDGSCENACGGQGSAGCFCDEACAQFDDCCDDVCIECPELSHCD